MSEKFGGVIINKNKTMLFALIFFVGIIFAMGNACATEKPTEEQIAQYKADGTLDERITNVTAIGNQNTDPKLINNLNQRLNLGSNPSKNNISVEPSSTRPTSTTLPSTGTVKMLIMLVDFPDYPHESTQSVGEIQSIYFGNGSGAYNTSINYYPYESLHNWYQRSSYGLLNITGDVLGWYTAQHNRSYYTNRMELMMEVMNYYDNTTDFSQYDNNGDGYMEGMALKWAGPDTGWGSTWWSYVITLPSSNNFTVDGVKMNKYMWAEYGANPKTDIHETGHLLGLPDLYDYDTGTAPYTNINGPGYGVGGLDMMDGGSSDFNCFFKMLLGWINPYYVTDVSALDQQLILNPAELNGTHSSVLIYPGQFLGPENKEFYMVEYRKKTGNDKYFYYPSTGKWAGGVPADGLYIWHIDATLDANGRFFYDNSNTVHNLVDLVQADGLFDIQNGSHDADAGDVYRPSKYFGPSTTPNSNWYSGSSGIYVYNLASPKNQTSAAFGWKGLLPIGIALENELLNWTTNGTGNVTWFGTQNIGQNDTNSAQSGFIWNNETTWMSTLVEGLGYLNFDWKVSSESGHDFLRFFIDGLEQFSISGEQDWQNKNFILGPGIHTLKWSYTKDGSDNNSVGSNCGWVDNLIWTPDTTPPIVNITDPINNAFINIGNKLITITFSEFIQEGSYFGSISVTGPSGIVHMNKTIVGNVLFLTPTADYVDGGYNLNIPANAVMDLVGNNLSNGFDSSFTVDKVVPTVWADVLGGLFNVDQLVSLAMSESGSIYYTLDNSTPSNSSTKYSGPISINNTSILKFLAVDLAGNPSLVGSESYVVDKVVPTVWADVLGGLFNVDQLVSLVMSESGSIYYTLDNSTPSNSSIKYSGPISINNTSILKFLAVDLAGNPSEVAVEAYDIDKVLPTAIADIKSGSYNTNQLVSLNMSEPGVIYYTLDGSTPSNLSIKYFGPISINSSTVLKFLAIDESGNPSTIYEENYSIDKNMPQAWANLKSGLYNTNKVISLTMSEAGSIYYTLNGSTPTTNSTKYTGPITISSSTILKFLAVDDSGNPSQVYPATYNIDKVAPKVVLTYPKHKAVNVSRTSTIYVKLSENLKSSVNWSKVYIKNLKTGKLVKISVSISGNVLKINTALKRSSYTWYSVYIPSGAVKDYAGNNLANSCSFRFKTGK